MYDKPVTGLIRDRYSCRSYTEESVNGETRAVLEKFLTIHHECPFGSRIRFMLAVAEENDSSSLKGLGTYGMIRNPRAFIIGAAEKSPRALEDYGFLMEKMVLRTADLGLGSCWLGGSFRKSRFADKISIRKNEILPAVASIGHPAPSKSGIDRITRFSAGSDRRKPREELFFDNDFSTPLPMEKAESYGEALEMLRLAPSASNRQPWRIVRDGGTGAFHFYLERSRGYTINLKLLKLADLQRVDMGIAMCHFELTARAGGLHGRWEHIDPGMAKARGEYVISWKE